MLIASDVLLRGEIGGEGWKRESRSIYSGPQFTSHLPTVLHNTGVSLKAAAGALLDGEGGEAWGHLEVSAASCQEYIPAANYDGLIDLVFARAENVPDTDHDEHAAVISLELIADGVERLAARMEQNDELRYPYREQASVVLANAADVLRSAVAIFEDEDIAPCESADPRGAFAKAEKDSDGAFNEGGDMDEDVLDDNADVPDEAAPAAAAEGRTEEGPNEQPLDFAGERMRAFKRELDAATARGGGPKERRALLKQLLRESHPDHNPGREAEVLPLFNYAVRMLHISGGSRRAR